MGHNIMDRRSRWKSSEPPGSRRFLAIARRIDGTKFAPAIAERTDGKWCLADLPDGTMAEIEIKRWMDIPPLRRARKRVLRPRVKEQASSFRL
jgi:hypothetical protein